MYFDNFHKDHQNKCMPFILQAWVSFYIVLKTTNLKSFTNNIIMYIKNRHSQDFYFQGYVGHIHENLENWSLENFQLYDSD